MSLLYLTSYNFNPKAVFILPVGSIEQHDNLPLGTDSLIAECIAWNIADRLPMNGLEAVVIPPLYYGFSPEWMGAPGTLSLSMESLCLVLKDISRSLRVNGVEKLVIINGHGGNSSLLEACVSDLSKDSITPRILLVNYYRHIRNAKLGHACRVERSLLEYCGISVPRDPQRIIEGTVGPEALWRRDKEPIAYIPPGDRPLEQGEIEDMISSITSLVSEFYKDSRL